MTIIPRIAALFVSLVVSLVVCLVQPVDAQTMALPLNAENVTLSGNGRFVVYTMAAGPTGAIWIDDRHSGQHERADVSSAGIPANHHSLNPGVSANGRFVVFWSRAGNLVAGDTNLVNDIFVRDRQTGQTTRETFHGTNADVIVESGQYLSISSDGRYVVFDTAHSLVAADTNTGRDVYVRDRTLGTYAIVTVSTAGQASPGPNGGGAHGRMSADGRFVTFTTYDADVLVPGVPGPGPSFGQILVRDLQTSQTTIVSRTTAGARANGYSEHPTISADGRYVAFISTAADLVTGDTNQADDAFVHDRDTGETTRASVSSAGGQANNWVAYTLPSISADGRYVAFSSNADNLAPMDANGAEDIYVRDTVFESTFRATLRSDQSEAPHCSGGNTTREPSISHSGIDMVVSTYLQLAGPCPSLHGKYLRRLWAASPRDFDLDRRADITVFRPGTSTWISRFSATETGAAWLWGAAGDIPTAADFDGDGRADYAVFRPSTGVWYWLHSWTNGSSYGQYHWGAPGDVPAPGDYDGDGKADPTVFRPSTGTWFAKLSGANYTTNLILQFGANGDVPVAADYDGDRKTDLAVFRPSSGVWFIRHSSTGAVVIRQWGSNGDVTVPGDYDGDERADIAVYRPSQGVWYIAKSTTDFATYDAIQWGVGADVPAPGDYNGDGRMDPAVFRPGSPATWWIYNQFALFWGTAGDLPIGGR